MLTGYWPVVGTAVALATSDGNVGLVVPRDEEELAESHATPGAVIRSFEPASLSELRTAAETVGQPLADVAGRLGLVRGSVGNDGGEGVEPAPYVAMHLYGRTLLSVLATVMPDVRVVEADAVLKSLRAALTPTELGRVREACAVARQGFLAGVQGLRAGITEAEAALGFRGPLSAGEPRLLDRARMDGFVYCMSGPNAARAAAAYQRSRGRRLQEGDLVLVHCNAYVGGYWTDVTRTYCLGEPGELGRRMRAAVFDARAAALAAVRPGARAADVDRAAREVMRGHGFGDDAFRHATGHGVGFAAIDHGASPRIHPKSDEVLEQGMVFNVEPAAYIEGYGGLRHCDMVAVVSDGMELLTPFHATPDDLSL
jgi:Xaa-Pro aminopeptidase